MYFKFERAAVPAVDCLVGYWEVQGSSRPPPPARTDPTRLNLKCLTRARVGSLPSSRQATAVVEYSSPEEAARAASHVHGRLILGQPVRAWVAAPGRLRFYLSVLCLSVVLSVFRTACLPVCLSVRLSVYVIKEAAEHIKRSRNAIALDRSRLTIYKHTAVNNYTET